MTECEFYSWLFVACVAAVLAGMWMDAQEERLQIEEQARRFYESRNS